MKKVLSVVIGVMLVFASVADPLPDGGPYKETVDGVVWTFTVVNGEASLGSGSLDKSAIAKTTYGSVSIPINSATQSLHAVSHCRLSRQADGGD